MKVLWFEISTPSNYFEDGRVVCGWQDALEEIVRGCKEIELYIAFESKVPAEIKLINGVTYIPICTHYSRIDRFKNSFDFNIATNKVIAPSVEVINRIKPDIIHVFGNEWPFGLIADYTDIPVVIHIQGSIVAYNNAQFPPKYNNYTVAHANGLNLRKQWQAFKARYYDASREAMERKIWKSVSNYMGRTEWDHALTNTVHPGANYFHVDEALRPNFIQSNKYWHLPADSKIRIVTVGCSSFWKGIDVMLKTAHILKGLNIDLEWLVAGYLNPNLKHIVEDKEKTLFAENNIRILGFIDADNLIDLLCGCTMYVHTAYIENSPNSICEAQYLGVPIISTMVGGISSLVRDGKDGKLLPANDPWQMANAIIELAEDKERMQRYSVNSRIFARNRHKSENILRDLTTTYKTIISCHNKNQSTYTNEK